MPRKVESNALTHMQVSKAKPKEAEYALSDGGGLSLVVKTDGGKRWLYRFSLHGERGKIWLGYYPDVSLSDARSKRDEVADQVSDGQDPRHARKVEAVTKKLEMETTFETLAREWHAKQVPGWSPNHARKVLESLEADAFPDLGGLPISSITAPLVLRTVQKMEKRGVTETAQRVLQRIGAVMRYAIQTGRAQTDPTYKLSETISAAKVKHRPAMPKSELPEYFRRLEAEPLHKITKLAFDLLAYTFVRPGELRGARWQEIDFEHAEWRIPAERMKMRSGHIVPLSRQALAVLQQLQPLFGRHELVFPAQSDYAKPMSENTLSYALGRMGYKDIHCPHGFRALASTILNEEGFNPDVIERQLAHAERNKVRAAYHRATYLKERRELLQWWADFLDSKRPGANIVPGRFGKQA